MVEEIHEPEGHAENSSGRQGRTEGIFRWLTQIFAGLLGLLAAVRSLLAHRAEERPVPVLQESDPGDAEEIRHPDGRIEHPRVRFEPTDASLGWILGIGIGTLVLAAVTFSALTWFFNHYKNYQTVIKRSPFPLAPGPGERLPARPHLEQLDRLAGIERSNIYEREFAKESLLHSYGTTPEKWFLRIPIEKAMDFLADKLPARPPPPAGQRRKENGLIDAGESNSGRLFREEPRWFSR